MRRLNKYKLKFDTALEYVRDELDKVNALSSELLDLLDFKSGYFFTLLTEDANLERIDIFKWGGVLPLNPITEYTCDNGHKSAYSIKNTIKDELTYLILKEMESNERLSCVMDKVTGSNRKINLIPIFLIITPYFMQMKFILSLKERIFLINLSKIV